MLSQRFVSLLPTSTSFVLLQKRKRELAPGYIWMDEETGVFLSLMQGDKTTIGYFNWMKLKNKKNKKRRCRGRRPLIMRKSPGSWKGFDRRDSSRHFSPWLFDTSGWCHSIMPSSFYSFNAEKFNSFYSKINEWPHYGSPFLTLSALPHISKPPTSFFFLLFPLSHPSLYLWIFCFFWCIACATTSRPQVGWVQAAQPPAYSKIHPCVTGVWILQINKKKVSPVWHAPDLNLWEDCVVKNLNGPGCATQRELSVHVPKRTGKLRLPEFTVTFTTN